MKWNDAGKVTVRTVTNILAPCGSHKSVLNLNLLIYSEAPRLGRVPEISSRHKSVPTITISNRRTCATSEDYSLNRSVKDSEEGVSVFRERLAPFFYVRGISTDHQFLPPLHEAKCIGAFLQAPRECRLSPGGKHSDNFTRGLLIPRASPAFTNAVGVYRRASSARHRADRRALLTAGDPADRRASQRAARRGQLVAVFRPETTPVLVPVADTTAVGVRDVAVSMPVVAALCLSRNRCGECQHPQDYKHR